MSKRRKNGKNSKNLKNLQYCEGCLASHRTLTSIEEYYHIYYLIMNDEIEIEDPSIKQHDEYPMMCFECRALLRNVEKLQMKFRITKEYLLKHSGKLMRKVMYLSDLTTSFNDTWIEATHQEQTDTQEVYLYRVITLGEESPLNTTNEDTILLPEIKTEDINIATESEIDYRQYPGYKNTESTQEIKKEQEFIDYQEQKQQEIYVEDNVTEIKDANKKKDEMSQKNIMTMRSKFIIVDQSSNCTEDFYQTVEIDDKERSNLLEKQKLLKNYKKNSYKCETCIMGFSRKSFYIKHKKHWHSKAAGDFECNLCKRRLRDKNLLISHIQEHNIKYYCRSCNFECLRRNQLYRHLTSVHKRRVMCLTCGKHFSKCGEFHKHYKRLHCRVICNYCNKSMNTKKKLITHIHSFTLSLFSSVPTPVNTRKSCLDNTKSTNTTKNTPEKLSILVPLEVKMRKKWLKSYENVVFIINTTVTCHRNFSCYDTLQRHKKYYHDSTIPKKYYHDSTISEDNYCMDCKRYFDNKYLLNIHLQNNRKHRN